MIALGLNKYIDEPMPIQKNLINTEDSKENTEKQDFNLTSFVVASTRKRMSEDDKQRFLSDYENHDKEYMLRKYDIKDARALANKVYLIRKEFGLSVRNR